MGVRFGGRAKGTRNKVTNEISAMCQIYGTESLDKMVRMMRRGETQAVQMHAAEVILAYAYGKPPQAQIHQGDPNKPIEFRISFKSGIDHASS